MDLGYFIWYFTEYLTYLAIIGYVLLVFFRKKPESAEKRIKKVLNSDLVKNLMSNFTSSVEEEQEKENKRVKYNRKIKKIPKIVETNEEDTTETTEN